MYYKIKIHDTGFLVRKQKRQKKKVLFVHDEKRTMIVMNILQHKMTTIQYYFHFIELQVTDVNPLCCGKGF